MSTSRTLPAVRVSAEAYARLEREAAEAGLSLSAFIRRELDVEDGDGRARRWAELRAALRGVLSVQPDDGLEALVGDPGPRRTAVLGALAATLRLGRALTTEEAGIAVDVATAELAIRLELEPKPED